MRLTSVELEHLKLAVQKFSPPSGTSLILYGSRVRDDLKGGDIDLVICVPDESCFDWKNKKLKILAEITGRIGEQRIDLSIHSEENLKTDPFFKTALAQSKIIAEW